MQNQDILNGTGKNIKELVREKVDILLNQLERIKNISQDEDEMILIIAALDESTKCLKKTELAITKKNSTGKSEEEFSETTKTAKASALEDLKEFKDIIDDVGEDRINDTLCENKTQYEELYTDKNIIPQEKDVKQQIDKNANKKDRNRNLRVNDIFKRRNNNKTLKPEIDNKPVEIGTNNIEKEVNSTIKDNKIETIIAEPIIGLHRNSATSMKSIESDEKIYQNSAEYQFKETQHAILENEFGDNKNIGNTANFYLIDEDEEATNLATNLQPSNIEESNANFAMLEDSDEEKESKNKLEENISSHDSTSEKLNKFNKPRLMQSKILEEEEEGYVELFFKSKFNTDFKPKISAPSTSTDFAMLSDSSEDEEVQNKPETESAEDYNFGMLPDSDDDKNENIADDKDSMYTEIIESEHRKPTFENDKKGFKPTAIIDDTVVELRRKTFNNIVAPKFDRTNSRDSQSYGQAEYVQDYEPIYDEIDEYRFTIKRRIDIEQSYEINRGVFQLDKFIADEGNSRGQPDDSALDSDETPPIVPDAKMKRKELIVKELIETEEKYINSLEYILKEYIEYVIKSGVTSKSKDQFNLTLGSIATISNESKVFLFDLRLHQNDYNQLGLTFLQHKKLFERYPLYCKYKCVSTEMLTGTIRDLIAKKENELQDSLGLNSRLMHPIQRMLKYELLLKELWKCLKLENKPVTAIDSAINFIKSIAQTCDFLILLESIKGKSFHKEETGDFLKRDVFHAFTPKDRQIVIFLFTNLIIFTEEDLKIKDAYNYKDHIFKSDITKVDCTDAGLRLQLYCKTSSKATFIYELEAFDSKTKADWNKMLNEVIKTNAKFNFPQLMRSKSEHHITQKPTKSHNRTMSNLIPFFNKNLKDSKKKSATNF